MTQTNPTALYRHAHRAAIVSDHDRKSVQHSSQTIRYLGAESLDMSWLLAAHVRAIVQVMGLREQRELRWLKRHRDELLEAIPEPLGSPEPVIDALNDALDALEAAQAAQDENILNVLDTALNATLDVLNAARDALNGQDLDAAQDALNAAFDVLAKRP